MSTSDQEPSMIIGKTVTYSVDGASVKIAADQRNPYLAYVEITGKDQEHSKLVRKIIEKQVAGGRDPDAHTNGSGGNFYILPFPQNFTQTSTLLTPKAFEKAAEELSGNQARFDELKGKVEQEAKSWADRHATREQRISKEDTEEMTHYAKAVFAALPEGKLTEAEQETVLDALVKTKGIRTNSRSF